MRDFVDVNLPSMVRTMDLKEALRFKLKLIPGAIAQLRSSPQGGSLLFRLNPGVTIYQYYVYPKPLYHCIHWEGHITIDPSKKKEGIYLLDVAPGKARIFFTGGPEYDALITHMEALEKAGTKTLLERSRAWWHAFTAKRFDFENRLPKELPHREYLLRTIDDVAVMMKTQQAVEGRRLQGTPIPLDMCGISTARPGATWPWGITKKPGTYSRYYRDIWQKTGELHCAQGIGVDGIFHIHENDEVESPGYLIMQAFDLQDKTRDRDFTREIFPMLAWCWEVQKKHLAGHMLPFNGDETYVAGGILPRSRL